MRKTLAVRVLFYIFLIILLLPSCNKSRDISNITIEVTETLQPEEILPLLNFVDFINDSLAYTGAIKSGSLASLFDSLPAKNNLDNNFEVTRKHTLYQKLEPNIQNYSLKDLKRPAGQHMHLDEKAIHKTSFLAYCLESDTAQVCKMLNNAGFFKTGLMVNWIAPYKIFGEKKYFYFVVLRSFPKVLIIHDFEIEGGKIVQDGESALGKFLARLKGKAEYFCFVDFKHEAIDKLKMRYPSDKALLFKCTIDNKDIYCSSTINDLHGKTLLVP